MLLAKNLIVSNGQLAGILATRFAKARIRRMLVKDTGQVLHSRHVRVPHQSQSIVGFPSLQNAGTVLNCSFSQFRVHLPKQEKNEVRHCHCCHSFGFSSQCFHRTCSFEHQRPYFLFFGRCLCSYQCEGRDRFPIEGCLFGHERCRQAQHCHCLGKVFQLDHQYRKPPLHWMVWNPHVPHLARRHHLLHHRLYRCSSRYVRSLTKK